MGFTYTFDANGNRSGLVDAGAGVFTYQWDAVDQVTTIVNRFSETTSLVYDALGRSTKRVLGNGVIGTYVYDSVGNQTGLHTSKSDGTGIVRFSAAYDSAHLVGRQSGRSPNGAIRAASTDGDT